MTNALIIGGGTGIGYAIAQLLVKRGFAVSIAGRRAEVIEDAVRALVAIGGPVHPLTGDIGHDGGPEALVEQHVERFGSIDTLICSAGVYEQVPFWDLTTAHWDRIFDINVRGSVFAALAAARAMRAAGLGRIVLVGSVLSLQSEPGTTAYSASKAALSGVVRSIAVDLGDANISVNCVAPGWVRTPMAADLIDAFPPGAMVTVNPMGRAADPAEIAEVVRFLVMDAPPFLRGQTLVVDGAQSARAPTL